MSEIKVIKVKENVLAKNDEEAQKVRDVLKEKETFMVNVMASPGSGKTTLLCNLINKLQDKGLSVGVMEADIDGDCDCKTIQDKTGAKAIQVHTGGACHMTAQMTKEGLEGLDFSGLDIVFIENVGNLVCPAEFDTGSDLNMMLLSVPEGDDKPLKYPLMFTVSQIAVISKIDVLPVFDFSLERVSQRIHKHNPNSKIFPVSAKKDVGVDSLADYLYTLVSAKKK
jgi:hydrogenase accessory protein hypB